MPRLQPQHVRDVCICLHVRRAARAATRLYDDALRPTGLTNGQFTLLMLVAGDPSVGMSALAEALAMDQSTVVAAVKPLVRDGLLSVSTHPQDKRARTLCVTLRGRDRLGKAMPLWEAAQAEMTRRVAAADLPRLREDLSAMAA
jgi:DNA-binding MarR family transcriptional regulator